MPLPTPTVKLFPAKPRQVHEEPVVADSSQRKQCLSLLKLRDCREQRALQRLSRARVQWDTRQAALAQAEASHAQCSEDTRLAHQQVTLARIGQQITRRNVDDILAEHQALDQQVKHTASHLAQARLACQQAQQQLDTARQACQVASRSKQRIDALLKHTFPG